MHKTHRKWKAFLIAILFIPCLLHTPKLSCEDSKPPFFVLHSTQHGIFADFAAVIGLLDYYESLVKLGFNCAGLSIELGEDGLYYDANKGPNYWEYYIEPLVLGDKNAGTIVDISLDQCGKFASHTLIKLTKERANALIKKYIYFKPFIQEKTIRFIEDNFKGYYIIGVHYRGTNKFLEAPLVSYEHMATEVREVIKSLINTPFKIFVASDEQRFIDYMEAQFPDLIAKTNANRSLDGTPVYMEAKNQYQNGEDAIIDSILLSGCNILIKTSSNVSYFSTVFNLNMPVKNVNLNYFDSK